MDEQVRRLLSFECDGIALGGSLDWTAGTTGVLIVTGGTQTRIGSHRIFERLAASLADEGHPCFRFDRRGVGDSEGEDPGFRANGQDIIAAAEVFRRECPHLGSIVGLGLCDGATSLAFFGATAGLSSLILVNPWLIETEPGAPAPAAIKHHYRRQLTSLAGWKKVLSGSISYRKLFAGVLKVLRREPPSGLAAEVAQSLAATRLRIHLILARHDATAVAAEGVWRSKAFQKAVGSRWTISHIDSDAHTFARPSDFDALRAACLEALSASGRH